MSLRYKAKHHNNVRIIEPVCETECSCKYYLRGSLVLLFVVINKNKIINRMFGSSFVTSTISLVTRAKHSNRRGFVVVSVTKLTNLHIWSLILFLLNKLLCIKYIFEVHCEGQLNFLAKQHQSEDCLRVQSTRVPQLKLSLEVIYPQQLDRKNFFIRYNYQLYLLC